MQELDSRLCSGQHGVMYAKSSRSCLKPFINLVTTMSEQDTFRKVWSNWDFLPIHDTTLGSGYNGKWVWVLTWVHEHFPFYHYDPFYH